MNYSLAIVLKLSPLRNLLQTWGRQNSLSVLEVDGDSSATDSPGVITIGVAFEVMLRLTVLVTNDV